jgi:hypothetical protein
MSVHVSGKLYPVPVLRKLGITPALRSKGYRVFASNHEQLIDI